MPHGGSRPGAGRPRKPRPKAVQEIRHFGNLAERLEDLPAGPIGRQRRCALVMSSFDVPNALIAAALAIDETHLGEFFAEELRVGNILKLSNLLHATWALAEDGKFSAINWLMKRMEQVAKDDERK